MCICECWEREAEARRACSTIKINTVTRRVRVPVAVRSCDFGPGAVLLREGGAGEEAPRLHLDCISAVPRLSLGCTSTVPRLYLGWFRLCFGCVSAMPQLYLG